jgi:DUF917 family protein
LKNTKRYVNGLQSFDCRTQVYRIDPCIVLESAGHEMAGIAASVSKSLEIINVAGPGRAFPGFRCKIQVFDLTKLMARLNRMEERF